MAQASWCMYIYKGIETEMQRQHQLLWLDFHSPMFSFTMFLVRFCFSRVLIRFHERNEMNGRRSIPTHFCAMRRRLLLPWNFVSFP